MDQNGHFPAKERITDDGLREMKLVASGITGAWDRAVISRESLGLETPWIEVCPRLANPYQWRAGRTRMKPNRASPEFAIRNDITIEMAGRAYRLGAPHIAALNKLLGATGELSVDYFTDFISPPSITRDSARVFAARVLDGLRTILGEEIVVKRENDQTCHLTTYQLYRRLAVHDARISYPRESLLKPAAAPKKVQPAKAKSQASRAPTLIPEPEQEPPPPAPLPATQVLPRHRSPPLHEATGPVRAINDRQVQKERMRRMLTSGAWQDAQTMSELSGVPMEVVHDFIERNRHAFGKNFIKPEQRDKIINGRRTTRKTEHFSPGFVTWALKHLPQFEQWLRSQG